MNWVSTVVKSSVSSLLTGELVLWKRRIMTASCEGRLGRITRQHEPGMIEREIGGAYILLCLRVHREEHATRTVRINSDFTSFP